MPFISSNNTRLFYRREGPDGRPVLVLSHSLGCDHGMWAPQIPALLEDYQVVRYDTRGHGASDVPQGEYSIEQLGRDLLGLMDALAIPKFAFCGISMGGAIGQWIAANAPQRVTAMVLANTSARFDAVALEARRRVVLDKGISAVADTVMHRFFSPDTLARSAHASSVRSVLLESNPVGYAGCCAALRDADHLSLLRSINVPTLVIGGDHDVSSPWPQHGEILAREIEGAQIVRLPAAHLSNIECPHAFTTALLEFLQQTRPVAHAQDAGARARREVLGNEHVDRALANANDFNREFQSLITQYAWGTIWTRPGLDRRTRRLLVLAMTASLGRWEEFRLHVGAALKHGLEVCDVKEALLQVAIYAGVPAANTSFHIAAEEMEKQKAGRANEEKN